MTTPFRFIDDNHLIIPRRRFGQPASPRGRKHGAVVLTGLPAIAEDDTSAAQDSTAQAIAEPAVKHDLTPSETPVASPRTENPVAKRSATRVESSVPAPRMGELAGEPLPEVYKIHVPTPPPVEIAPSSKPQPSNTRRRVDAPRSPIQSNSMASHASNAAEPNETAPKTMAPIRRWASVLLTTLAIVGAALFLTSLLNGNHPPNVDAPLSGWDATPSAATMVSGDSTAPPRRDIKKNRRDRVVPRFESSLDDLPVFHDVTLDHDKRERKTTSAVSPTKAAETIARRDVLENPVADLASSPAAPKPTRETAHMPVADPLLADSKTTDPKTAVQETFPQSQKVRHNPDANKYPTRQISSRTNMDNPNSTTASPPPSHGANEISYPTTNPSTYRRSSTIDANASMPTPQCPGSARLDGSIHNYRRPR